MNTGEDLTGRVFGKLTVIGREPKRKVHCRCECGRLCTVDAGNLRSGRTTSCNNHRDHVNQTHGHTKNQRPTPEYRTWQNMLKRCYKPNAHRYERYGGRGIRVCDRWRSFENFLADMGSKPSPKYSLDRINNDGNYEPSNCRWSSLQRQSRNKSTSRMLDFNGKSMCVADWADEVGIKRSVLNDRLRRGWTVERTLTTPVGGGQI